MNFDTMPKGKLYTLRGLAAIALPVAVLIVSITVFFASSTLAAKIGWFLDGEAIFLGIVPFIITLWVALGLRWSGNRKAAKKVATVSLVIFTLVFAASSVVSTINTKPILTAANQLAVPDGMTVDPEENANSFTPALGLFPCVDLQATGCPQVKRGWVRNDGQELTKADLQKIIEDSGWSDVKIQEDNCNLTNDKNGRYISCYAEGIVNDYKTTVGITKVSGEWELRLYVRDSDVR